MLRHARVHVLVLSVVCLAGLARPAYAQVPKEYVGQWVPAAAACTSPLRVIVAPASITLVNAADKESLGGIEMAGPGFFQPDYRGIQAVAITEFDGDQPLFATFNAGEKRGVALMEYSPIVPGPPGNKELTRMQAHLQKLNLAKRFPLGGAMLKKCP